MDRRPVEYGGAGLPGAYRRAFDALVRNYDVIGNGMLTIGLGMVAPTILAHGTPSAKERYLPALQRGDLIACQLFSEPSAGSDLASVAMRAERDGDGWRLNGQKVWTSGAQFSDIGEALCRTSDEGRHRNLTAFVVDMHAPGVDVRPLRQMTGGASFNEVFLTDVWVPDEDRLAEVGAGWPVAITTLSNERTPSGARASAAPGCSTWTAQQRMVRHFGLAADPVARQRLADLVIETRVAKYSAASAPPPRHGPAGHRDRRRRSASSRCRATCPASPTSSALCSARSWSPTATSGAPTPGPSSSSGDPVTLGGGTDEILMTMIGERVLGLPKEPTQWERGRPRTCWAT